VPRNGGDEPQACPYRNETRYRDYRRLKAVRNMNEGENYRYRGKQMYLVSACLSTDPRRRASPYRLYLQGRDVSRQH
jgi:hypothetical protein